MAIKGTDVSAHQGVIKEPVWKQNQKNLPYTIIRASYTTQAKFTLNKDKYFDKTIKNAYNAKMRIGAYHYSQAISETEAIKEARFIIGILKPYKDMITLPVAFDWEFGGRLNSYVAKKMGKQRCKQICDAFCREIQKAGYEPIVYANLSTLNGYIESDIYKNWKIWVAQYHSKCDYKHPYYLWQYTSGGRVKGIPGRVDMDLLYEMPVVRKQTVYTKRLPTLPKRGWFTSGDKGTQVKLLQEFLNWYGDYGLLVDGEVGRKTMDAVRRYEGREKIKPIDGLFGEKCLERAKKPFLR